MMTQPREKIAPAGRLVTVSRPAPGLTTAAFLGQARGRERFYWSEGREEISLAGFGIAAQLMAWGEDRFLSIEKQARRLFADALLPAGAHPLAGPRLFGGFAFRDDFTPDNTWSVFHPAHFILPHYQLLQVDGQSWLTLNALLPNDEPPAENLPQLQEALDTRYQLLLQANGRTRSAASRTAGLDVNYPMPYRTWEAMIERAVARMKQGEMEKVVLSRVCEIRLGERVDVDDALAYLSDHYANCYRFLFEPRPYHAFYGATPELLAQVDGRQVETMALASSIRRGATPAEDERLAEQLRRDPKEKLEHHLVVTAIRERLAPRTERLELPEVPGIYPLHNIQHLVTPIRGRLHKEEGILPIVAALHPTPALGGAPQDRAMAFISEAEPVPRGWYAGPIGWLDHRLEGRFAVAIRSAVSQERRVWLYAGAGIVADSLPRREWDETALKFRPMLDALGIRAEVGG